VIVLTPCQGNARVLEGLAASGLRSIRYALELDGVSRIDANDLDPAVVDSMRANIALNGLQVQARVVPTCSDARLLMLQSPEVGARAWPGGSWIFTFLQPRDVSVDQSWCVRTLLDGQSCSVLAWLAIVCVACTCSCSADDLRGYIPPSLFLR
jgi:hypothetical protein